MKYWVSLNLFSYSAFFINKRRKTKAWDRETTKNYPPFSPQNLPCCIFWLLLLPCWRLIISVFTWKSVLSYITSSLFLPCCSRNLDNLFKPLILQAIVWTSVFWYCRLKCWKLLHKLPFFYETHLQVKLLTLS